jgi:hypothetical protein
MSVKRIVIAKVGQAVSKPFEVSTLYPIIALLKTKKGGNQGSETWDNLSEATQLTGCTIRT